jgi:deazaflavin-dependent oxidoreductase (nitroreductase family)
MSSFDPQYQEKIRQSFKYFNPFMLALWRLGLGRYMNFWPEIFGRYLVLTHTGRKSGLRRRTPLNYIEVGRNIYIAAGFGSGSDWYRNVKASPQVEIWTSVGWWAAEVEEVPPDDPRRIPLLRQIAIASGFAAPLFGLDPHRMSDDELEELTQDYRLLRLWRVRARTGRGGPGELTWVWPLAVLFLLPLALMNRRR